MEANTLRFSWTRTTTSEASILKSLIILQICWVLMKFILQYVFKSTEKMMGKCLALISLILTNRKSCLKNNCRNENERSRYESRALTYNLIQKYFSRLKNVWYQYTRRLVRKVFYYMYLTIPLVKEKKLPCNYYIMNLCYEIIISRR